MGTTRQRQSGSSPQRDLFAALDESGELRHGDRGAGGTQSAAPVESPPPTASTPPRPWNAQLMEQIATPDNLKEACRKVKSNHGKAGLDRVTVEEFEAWLNQAEHGAELARELPSGEYQPAPVRAVDIRKPDGGMRRLGIPTVKDRVVQQAFLGVLQPLIDPTFSDHSYGWLVWRDTWRTSAC